MMREMVLSAQGGAAIIALQRGHCTRRRAYSKKIWKPQNGINSKSLTGSLSYPGAVFLQRLQIGFEFLRALIDTIIL